MERASSCTALPGRSPAITSRPRPAGEREQILQNLLNAREPGFEIVSDRSRIDALLEKTRAAGYGARFGEEPVESGAIAVPILLGERVLGCVNITFIRRAMSPEDAARSYVGAMCDAARQIAEGAASLADV